MIFSYFSQKIGFDITYKLSPKCESLFSWKKKKTISKRPPLKLLSSLLNINPGPAGLQYALPLQTV